MSINITFPWSRLGRLVCLERCIDFKVIKTIEQLMVIHNRSSNISRILNTTTMQCKIKTWLVYITVCCLVTSILLYCFDNGYDIICCPQKGCLNQKWSAKFVLIFPKKKVSRGNPYILYCCFSLSPKIFYILYMQQFVMDIYQWHSSSKICKKRPWKWLHSNSYTAQI